MIKTSIEAPMIHMWHGGIGYGAVFMGLHLISRAGVWEDTESRDGEWDLWIVSSWTVLLVVQWGSGCLKVPQLIN